MTSANDPMLRFLGSFRCRPRATDAAIAESEQRLGLKLPKEYVAFLRLCNGGDGVIGDEEYAILWSVEELASLNDRYEVQSYVPGLLIFGSNGGGEAYGFDTRIPNWPIVSVPFVGMEWELAEPIGASFSLCLERLYQTKELSESESMSDHNRESGITASQSRGKEIFEIHPVILGGSPTDPANKVVLNRAEHMQAVVYWNRVIAEIRRQKKEAMKKEPGG